MGYNDEKIYEIKMEENCNIYESTNNPRSLLNEFNQIVMLYSYPSLINKELILLIIENVPSYSINLLESGIKFSVIYSPSFEND